MRSVCALFVAACSSSAPAPVAPIAPSPDAAIDAVPDAAPDAPPDAPAIDGMAVYQAKGCVTCHSLDGTLRIGPSLQGLWRQTITMSDGSQVVADEVYIRESILEPAAKARPGFAPVMPVFRGVLTDAEIDALIALVQSLH
jgi:cytochrome c oxidase subunit 2